MRKTSLHQKQNKSRVSIVISVLVVSVLTFMTVGFATYNQILTFDGAITLKPQGEVRITDVRYVSGEHSTGNPTFTDTTIDFGLSFNVRNPENEKYNATYRVTIKNDTFYSQVFSISEYQPIIKDRDDNVVEDPDINFQLSGIQNGDGIASGQEITFDITFNFSPSDDGRNTYTIDNEMEVEFTDEQVGQMFARVSSSTTGNLRSPNTRAAFTVTVINTFDYDRDFNLELRDNGHFYLGTANGSRTVTGTVGANATADFTVYVYEEDSTMEYSSDYERASIYLKSNGIADINAGRITLLVDKKVVSTDTEAPTVSNLVATQQTSEGEVLLTWDASDESTINNFTIQIFQDNNNTPVRTITTDDDETSYTVTGLTDDTYYFRIYGTDAHGNTATAAEISSATTATGHATRSANVTFDWNFSITYNLNRITSTNNARTIKMGQTYTTTLRYDNNANSHPTSATITMGGQTLSNSAYSYNTETGALSIPNVTGDLVITASRPAFCLIEGTEVALWDGSTKKIEDVKYDDLLKVWSYNLGRFVPSYPIWMEREHTASEYRLSTFSDGTTLGTVGYHSVFSVDAGKFVSVDTPEYYEGLHILKEDGDKLVPVTVEKIEMIKRPVKYYNVVSTYYYNILGNNILTADGMSIISNLYGFTEDYRWPATRDIAMSQPGALYDYSLFQKDIPTWMFKGLRIQEAGIVRDYFPVDQLSALLRQELLSEEMLAPNTMRPQFTTDLGARYWMFTTSEDSLTNKQKYLVREGSTKIVPTGAWFNTSDGKTYHGGDKIQVWTSVHLIKL